RAGRVGERRRLGIEHGLDFARFEPARRLHQMLRGGLQPGFCDYTDAVHLLVAGAPRPAPRRSLAGPRRPAPLAASLRRCRKNSRLPTSPVIGDSVMFARTNPTSPAHIVASRT